MPPNEDQLLELIQRFGGFDNEASTDHAMHMFAYFKAHQVGFLDSLTTALKMLEALAEMSTAHHILVCETLALLLKDLQREQN